MWERESGNWLWNIRSFSPFSLCHAIIRMLCGSWWITTPAIPIMLSAVEFKKTWNSLEWLRLILILFCGYRYDNARLQSHTCPIGITVMTTRTMARKQARYPQIWGLDAMQNISRKPMSTDLGGAKAIVFKSLLKLKQLSSSRTQQEEDFYRNLISLFRKWQIR